MKNPMKTTARAALLCLALASPLWALAAPAACSNATADIPKRPLGAIGGKAFVASLAGMGEAERDASIKSQLMSGNIPNFLRRAWPESSRAAMRDGKVSVVTFCALPDYLAVGSDDDFVLAPLSLDPAMDLSERFGLTLPTRMMVDMIYRNAVSKLAPIPLPAGPQMRSTPYFAAHNAMIDQERAASGAAKGVTTAGHKKDLVLSPKLWTQPGRETIYGWHRLDGAPIQSLSTAHGSTYADYSHGARLIGKMAVVDGVERSVADILSDPALSALLSDEGPLPRGPAPRAPAVALTSARH